jgi:ABC-type phosphate transport system substrate-binding protein
MKRFLRLLLVAAFLLPPAGAAADLVVVVNPKSGVDKLNRDEVVNIFLGRYRQLPSGMPALPADLPATQPDKAVFYRLLVDKELAEINSYWARLIFSGRTVPPKQSTGNDDLLKWVAATPGAIGYIERSKVDGRVRIVYEFAP